MDLGPWAGGRLYATMLAVDFGREGPGGRAREPPTPLVFFKIWCQPISVNYLVCSWFSLSFLFVLVFEFILCVVVLLLSVLRWN